MTCGDKWTLIRCTTEISEKIYENKPVDFICNNCLLQQMPQIDIFDTKDLDNNITHSSTITAHVTNVPEEKENIFEFPNLKTNAFYSCECKINPTKNIGT